ncbi:MAG: hypothetical protein ACPG4N_06895 [Gammaproteobacteria bacterium]
MAKYIFTLDQRDNTFPERYRVVSAEDDADFLRKSEDLTGTILDTEALAFLEGLIERCQSSDSIIPEFVDAPHWRFIELRYNPAEADRMAEAQAGASGSGDSD